VCARLSRPLAGRGQARDDRIRVPIGVDADVVTARSTAREAAAKVGFRTTDLTVIATAVSEVSRNIVRFAGSGEVLVELLGEPRPGVRIVARDAGPGIPDVARAMADGFSTYDGLGLGLPGARRLMDEFDLESEVGRGTTVTMTKWLGGRR
jgi:anti-sigma regulatory factor (Ser/Thr protein kinase)